MFGYFCCNVYCVVFIILLVVFNKNIFWWFIWVIFKYLFINLILGIWCVRGCFKWCEVLIIFVLLVII